MIAFSYRKTVTIVEGSVKPTTLKPLDLLSSTSLIRRWSSPTSHVPLSAASVFSVAYCLTASLNVISVVYDAEQKGKVSLSVLSILSHIAPLAWLAGNVGRVRADYPITTT